MEDKNKLALSVFLFGLILIGLGILGLKIFNSGNGPKVEILGESAPAAVNTDSLMNIINIIKVEIAGEVIKPGVYELKEGSRVNDLLIAGGGLSAKADREWVAKSVNLAQKLTDGAKIYIPAVSTNWSNLSNLSNSPAKVNLNTASEAELDKLWGIGEATAKKIIDSRPYSRTETLLEKKIVNKGVWEKIKDEITVY